jgi:hypothetical protein
MSMSLATEETSIGDDSDRAMARRPATVCAGDSLARANASPADQGRALDGDGALLQGMIQTGWAVIATWPMRTELGNRVRGQDANAPASSVGLACRPREESAGTTDRRG